MEGKRATNILLHKRDRILEVSNYIEWDKYAYGKDYAIGNFELRMLTTPLNSSWLQNKENVSSNQC